VKEQVGDRSIFLLASGGVDSTVAAALLGKALGPERVNLLHVDNGLMRKDESQQVLDLFRELGLDEHLHFVDASATFLAALDGVTDPERKRAIIGETFVRVFEEKARELGIEDHLDQGDFGAGRQVDVLRARREKLLIQRQPLGG
jgi:GMP synthase (glutamine-hydrolysing)